MLGATDLSARASSGTSFHEIRVGSTRRNFLLHLPPLPLRRPAPVFFLLHGSSANANVMMHESGMNAIADSIGAIVVYPNGTGEIPYFRLFWNESGCCVRSAPVKGADEERMLAAIVDTLGRLYSVDHSRIGLAGFSDPGSMAYSIACDQSELWTAIGVIAGRLPKMTCAPKRGVSTIVFHGLADQNIRYGATREDVASWARNEQCGSARTDTAGPAEIADYAGCKDGAEVELYSIFGGRHGWPGGKRSSIFAPRPPQGPDATRLFAMFVYSHPRPTGTR